MKNAIIIPSISAYAKSDGNPSILPEDVEWK